MIESGSSLTLSFLFLFLFWLLLIPYDLFLVLMIIVWFGSYIVNYFLINTIISSAGLQINDHNLIKI